MDVLISCPNIICMPVSGSLKEGTCVCAEAMGVTITGLLQGCGHATFLGTNLHIAANRLMSPSPKCLHLIRTELS